MTEACIPDIYMPTAHQEFGNPRYPWVAAPAGVVYPAVARTAADFIADSAAAARIGLLRQSDDLGGSLKDEFIADLKGGPYGLVDEMVMAFDPNGPPGQRYRSAQSVVPRGAVPYQPAG